MGSYQDGIFKFIMKIPENFPDGDCPVSIYTIDWQQTNNMVKYIIRNLF